MADARYFAKKMMNRYVGDGWTDRQQVWHGDAERSSLPNRPLKLEFLKSKMAGSRHLWVSSNLIFTC